MMISRRIFSVASMLFFLASSVCFGQAGLNFDGTNASQRAGKAGFYNGCPQPQTVYITVCQGLNGQNGHSNFQLPPGQIHMMDVNQYSTFSFMCSANGSMASQNCPGSAGFALLLRQ